MVLAASLVIAALLLVNALYVAAEFAPSACVAAGSISSLKTATRSRPGCCQSSNRLRRSIATLPPARSASRFRASFSAPTRKRRLLSGWPRTRRTGWTSGGCRRVDVHHRRAAGTDGGTSGLCGARAQIGGPSISDADGPLHPHPNGRLAVGLSPVHHMAERIRPLILRLLGARHQAHRPFIHPTRSNC